MKILLLCLSLTITGCGTFCERLEPKDPSDQNEPTVIVVEKSQIKQLDNGNYEVNKAWFMERMSIEQELVEALGHCLDGGYSSDEQ